MQCHDHADLLMPPQPLPPVSQPLTPAAPESVPPPPPPPSYAPALASRPMGGASRGQSQVLTMEREPLVAEPVMAVEPLKMEKLKIGESSRVAHHVNGNGRRGLGCAP